MIKFNLKRPMSTTSVRVPVHNKKYGIIPLKLFQAWHTLDLPPKMRETIDSLRKQNPEFTHYLYDDAMCRNFISQHFDQDTLYAFDKLKPGAYKADLWRYCILYINGGIYLDVKYNCVNGFKLLELTDKEYFVKGILYSNNLSMVDQCKRTGVHNALISSLPNNKILLNCIEQIVYNVKHNLYNKNEFDITGPHIFIQCERSLDINKLELANTGKAIVRSNTIIIKGYEEYRDEQSKTQLVPHYYWLWLKKDVYNYPTLKYNNKIDFSRKITKNIMGKYVNFNSGTPTIIELSDNTYLINIRWINYNYNDDGSKLIIPSQWMSLNSRFTVDEHFNRISEEVFLIDDFVKEQNNKAVGLEDIRIFNYDDLHYYIASSFDDKRQIISSSSGIYDIVNNNSYELNKNIILPKMYDLVAIRVFEKNWSFVNYKNDLCVVYNWFPLQIGKIDYETNEMDIIERIYDIPDYFKDARGSTAGFRHNNEIWFVLHKSQSYSKFNHARINNTYYNYQHFFAIFDLDMKLLRYSELFKLGDCKVEFCIGLIVKEREIILSYSLLDTQSIVATYDIDYIKNNIKWYYI